MKQFWSHFYSREIVATTSSIIIHLFVIALFSINSDLNRFFFKSKKTNQFNNILIDLSDLKETQEIIDNKVPFISQKNRALKGKLTEKKGIHILSPKSLPQNPTKYQAPSLSVVILEDNDNGKEEKKKNFLQKKKNVQNPNKKQNQQILKQLVTENISDYRFNFNLEQPIQIGSRKDKNAEFYLEFSKIIKKQFITYIQSSLRQNLSYVNADKVSSVGKIFKDGSIVFVKVKKISKKQPYFNYLAERVINKPGKISKVPKSILGRKKTFAFFELSIIFTGPPGNQWWCGYQFYPSEE